ncbi:MAG: T9SS type A sorting domain-containing protein, partial [Bacteroidota bacterium]
NGHAELVWRTAYALNSEDFTIERYQNDKTWETLGTVKTARANAAAIYTFRDETPQKGLNYYRLRMRDRDGAVRYSDTRAVYFPTTISIVKAYPNPFEQNMTISVTGEQQEVLTLRVVDMLGKVMSVQSVELQQDGTHTFELDISDALTPGQYMLSIVGKHVQRAIKIVKK